MAVWGAYAIPGQPADVLLDRDRREHARWLGAFDPADVVTAARSLRHRGALRLAATPKPNFLCVQATDAAQVEAAWPQGSERHY